jgi:hypothetical protein
MNTEYAKEDAELGTVVPFRYGYDPIPYTLSNCETDRLPKDAEARERYFYTPPGRRDFDTKEQEITENTYANYRYYPESLSAMLLKKEHADGLYNMRKSLGGNLVGMVRFRSWLDDWTATSYARFLIETDRIEDYLLLLYAHTKHHGHPELLCYYEQVKPYGAMSANDCVPSLLTTPIMCAWIFAYERVGGGLRLLSALPRDWYGKPFSVLGLGTSYGRLDVLSDGEYITVRSEFGMPRGTELVWRCKDTLTREDILVGGEAVESVCGNVLTLCEGIKEFKIKVK